MGILQQDIRQELVHKLSKKSSVADVQEASAVTGSLTKPTDMDSGISDVADGTEVDSSHHNTVQSGHHVSSAHGTEVDSSVSHGSHPSLTTTLPPLAPISSP